MPFDQSQSTFGLLDKKCTSTQRTHRPEDAQPETQGTLTETKESVPADKDLKDSKWTSTLGREHGWLQGSKTTADSLLRTTENQSCIFSSDTAQWRQRGIGALELWPFKHGLWKSTPTHLSQYTPITTHTHTDQHPHTYPHTHL